MNWYLTKMVFQIICGDGKHVAQFEEQLRLIYAEDAYDAMQKAKTIGLQEEQSFSNHRQQPVKWKLIAVTDVYPFTTGLDGAEIFSRISEEEQATAFIYTMRLRAADAARRCNEFIQI
jgi:Domain of unknown function (DUF4288)